MILNNHPRHCLWKNCLLRNWSLVPKRFETTALTDYGRENPIQVTKTSLLSEKYKNIDNTSARNVGKGQAHALLPREI